MSFNTTSPVDAIGVEQNQEKEALEISESGEAAKKYGSTSSSFSTSPVDASGVEQSQAKEALEFSEFGEAPDGGLQAWLVAAGGAAIFFCCLGFSNSFGTFEQYYLTHQLQHEPPDNIAWIGSLSLFLQFAAGAFGGPLFDLFGPWVRLQKIPAAWAGSD